MSRFQLALTGTCMLSGWAAAQFAASFPLVRSGCFILILAAFMWFGIDALMDKARTEAEGHDAELLTIITPHICHAVGFLFLVLVGIYVGATGA
jgi:hypothetical protein